MPRQAGSAPTELRRIHSGQMHDGDMNLTLVVDQLAAERVGETDDGVLGAAIRRL